MDPGWIVAAVALGTAVVTILGWVARWSWHLTRRIIHFLDDYAGEPAREGLPARPGFMARLTSVEQLVAKVAEETTPNGGKSLRDVVHRTARDVAEIKAEQAAMKSQISQLPGGSK